MSIAGPSARSGATSRSARSRSSKAATTMVITGLPDQLGRHERRRRRELEHRVAAQLVGARAMMSR